MSERVKSEPIIRLDVSEVIKEWEGEDTPRDTDERGNHLCSVCKLPERPGSKCKNGDQCKFPPLRVKDLLIRLVNVSASLDPAIEEMDRIAIYRIGDATGRAKDKIDLTRSHHDLILKILKANKAKGMNGQALPIFTPMIWGRFLDVLENAKVLGTELADSVSDA